MITLKLIVIMVVVLIVIVGFASFIYYQTSTISGELLDSLAGIKQHIEKEKWERVHHEIDRLNNHWEKADRWWTPFMDHRELDLLDQSIGRVFGLVEVRLKEEALVEVNTAMRLVQRILDREAFNISNIL